MRLAKLLCHTVDLPVDSVRWCFVCSSPYGPTQQTPLPMDHLERVSAAKWGSSPKVQVRVSGPQPGSVVCFRTESPPCNVSLDGVGRSGTTSPHFEDLRTVVVSLFHPLCPFTNGRSFCVITSLVGLFFFVLS